MSNTPNDTPMVCAECDRPIRPAAKVWHVHVMHGVTDGGWHPVGSDCAKRLRAEGAEVERLAVAR